MNDESFIKLRNKFLLSILATVIILSPIFLFFMNRYGDFSSEVLKKIASKEEYFIYFMSSSDCDSCTLVGDVIDNSGVKYYKYDTYREKDLDDVLYAIGLSKDVLTIPGVVYMKDGQMQGNLMDIENEDVLQKFLHREFIKE